MRFRIIHDRYYGELFAGQEISIQDAQGAEHVDDFDRCRGVDGLAHRLSRSRTLDGGVAALAIVTGIVRGILVYVLAVAMGLPGLYLGLLIAAVLLGVALSALYGMELKRAVMVAGIFMVVHLVISYGLSSMMNRAAQVALELPGTVWLA